MDITKNKVAPSYNKLTVVSTVGQTVLLTFDGYVQPPSASKAVYIVKGTSLGKTPVIFHVNGFEQAGFRIQFPSEYKEGFMLEVSMFFTQ